MADQTIPADKVRELADKYDQDSSGNPERLLVQAIADLRTLLPAQQPTTGLLGRWAKHPEHGDVVCVWDRPDAYGYVFVRWIDEKVPGAVDGTYAPLSDLTFPHQATRPEDVPENQPWLVDVESPYVTKEGATGFRYSDGEWIIINVDGNDGFTWDDCYDKHVTLIAPLVPERPVSDLQAKYDALEERWKHLDNLYSARGRDLDELEDKYLEAQERIKTLEQPSTPRTVTTEQEYAALPVGSVVAKPGGAAWHKSALNRWCSSTGIIATPDRNLADTTRTVLRFGWGDEQPAWRIEHDPDNLRVDEYIIDNADDTGTVTSWNLEGDPWFVSGMAVASPNFAPFIVFPNKEAATPEAVAEARKARDKEMEK